MVADHQRTALCRQFQQTCRLFEAAAEICVMTNSLRVPSHVIQFMGSASLGLLVQLDYRSVDRVPHSRLHQPVLTPVLCSYDQGTETLVFA